MNEKRSANKTNNQEQCRQLVLHIIIGLSVTRTDSVRKVDLCEIKLENNEYGSEDQERLRRTEKLEIFGIKDHRTKIITHYEEDIVEENIKYKQVLK